MSEKPRVELSDSGFRYGLGVFETVVVRKGVALFYESHLRNLITGAKYLGLSIEVADNPGAVPVGDGIWRWFLTSSGLNTMFEAGIDHVPANYTLDLSRLRVSSEAWDSRLKTLSYLLHYQARHETRYDETILLNEREEIASASMANVFWLQDGTLFTPDHSCGCRAGVVRHWVMENWQGEMEQGRWAVEELEAADEIFVTNSRIGIMPVILWRGRNLRIGPDTETLRKLYHAEVERQLSAVPDTRTFKGINEPGLLEDGEP